MPFEQFHTSDRNNAQAERRQRNYKDQREVETALQITQPTWTGGTFEGQGILAKSVLEWLGCTG